MIKLFDSFPRVCALVVLLLGYVVGAQAATITYKLTTHTRTTNQTLTGTANLSTGASLLNNMPQALWRAYCTYTFYSDEAMTQEITTAPSTASYVYVDYVFDPPFIMSEEGSDPVWHYLRAYNEDAQNYYYIYYNKRTENEWGQKTIKAYNGGLPPIGNLGTNVEKQGHREWAFYGDAYDFHVKINDESLSNQWLVWTSESTDEAPVRLGQKKSLGWQLYVNKATTTRANRVQSGTMAMGVPLDNTTNYLVSLQNVSYYIETAHARTYDYFEFNSHNELINTRQPKTLWWFALFATPVTASPTTTDIWRVTYKILKAYDYKAQRGSDQTAQKPQETPIIHDAMFDTSLELEGCSYMFYKDAELTQMFGESETLPTGCNSVIYVKESCPIEDHWTTFVSPIDITNPATYFGSKDDGVTPAIAIQEYKTVALEQVGTDVVNAELTFETVNTIEAGMPYLINFDGVGSIMKAKYETARDDAVTNNAETLPECIAVGKTDDDNSVSGVTVSMKGTYSEIPLAAHNSSSDELNFYLGYLKNSKTYKFYVVTKEGFKLPAYHCYFYITGVSDVNLSYTGVADGIGEIISSTPASFSVNGVYNLNGQLVRGGNSIDGLPAGIYVVNGKKLVVR